MDSAEIKTDINLMVAGQGGDGSLTIISILSELLNQYGYNLYIARDVASRIKGGFAGAILRGSIVWRSCIGDTIDLLLAFDREAIEKTIQDMSSEGIIIFDSSDGPFDIKEINNKIKIIQIPFGRYAVRDLRRDIFKNSLSFALITRIFHIKKTQATKCFKKVLQRLPEKVIKKNLEAFEKGLQIADNIGLETNNGPWKLKKIKRKKKIFIGGNEALAFGFTVAGGRFFTGYPITPASEILEWLKKHLSKFGGIALQAEDELSAVNMAIGAALTGTRSMTATSSPGFSLMLEGITQSGAAEVPLVIVNSQRAGPSTGMPTKPEQSDIGMMIYGGNGEFPRIVLSPGGPSDCFEAGIIATNLSQKIQSPVIIAIDQAVAQDSRTVDSFDLESINIDKGYRLDVNDLSQKNEYKRYAITENGISPWTVPGTPNGMTLITGNERNEWGLVSTEPKNRKIMMDKRQKKIDSIISDLPLGRRWGDESAIVGLLGIGMETGVVSEAVERLCDKGLSTKGLQPRTLWPVLDETLEFIESCLVVYIIEHNKNGQLMQLLLSQGVHKKKLKGYRRYDGLQNKVGKLVEHISRNKIYFQNLKQNKL